MDTTKRNVIVSSYVTLDGRVDDVQNWAVPFDDDGAARHHTALLANSDALLLGRRTYEIFAAVWPARAGTLPYVDKLNRMTKYVASTTLTELDWEDSHLLVGDVAERVAELKREPGQDLVAYGGRDLVQTLMEHDLVDEYRLLVQPVLLGTGRSLLAEGLPRIDLDLIDATVVSSGMTVLTYRPRA